MKSSARAILVPVGFKVGEVINDLKRFVAAGNDNKRLSRVEGEVVGSDAPLSLPCEVDALRGIVWNKTVFLRLRLSVERIRLVIDNWPTSLSEQPLLADGDTIRLISGSQLLGRGYSDQRKDGVELLNRCLGKANA